MSPHPNPMHKRRHLIPAGLLPSARAMLLGLFLAGTAGAQTYITNIGPNNSTWVATNNGIWNAAAGSTLWDSINGSNNIAVYNSNVTFTNSLYSSLFLNGLTTMGTNATNFFLGTATLNFVGVSPTITGNAPKTQINAPIGGGTITIAGVVTLLATNNSMQGIINSGSLTAGQGALGGTNATFNMPSGSLYLSANNTNSIAQVTVGNAYLKGASNGVLQATNFLFTNNVDQTNYNANLSGNANVVIAGGANVQWGNNTIGSQTNNNSFIGTNIIQNNSTLTVGLNSQYALGATNNAVDVQSGTLIINYSTNTNGGNTAVVNVGNVTLGNGTITGNTNISFLTATNWLVTNNQPSSIKGISIGGSGALTFSGTTNLVLASSNSYTGGTIINGGATLINQGGNPYGLGATSGPLNIAWGSLQNTSPITVGNFSMGNGTVTPKAGTITATNFLATNSGSSILQNGLAGNASFTMNGKGTMELNGPNSYTGTTVINSGTIAYTGTNASTAVTVNSGATLSGTGLVGSVTVTNGATITPGLGGGTGSLSVSSMIWYGGGTNNWYLYDATRNATAGSAYSTIFGSGSLDLSALSSSNKFTINLATIRSTNGGSGAAINWNSNTSTFWTLGTFSGGITGFSTNNFILNFANFNLGGTNGTFALTTINTGGSTNALALQYTTAYIPNGQWSNNSGNLSDILIYNTSTLEFMSNAGSAPGGVLTNNAPASMSNTLVGIQFDAGTGTFTLTGSNPITNGVGGIVNNSTNGQTVALNLTLGTSQNFSANSGNLNVSSNVTIGGNTLTLNGGNNITLGGGISGTGAVIAGGTGTVTLSASNSYQGGTLITGGQVNLGNNSALGATNGSLNVAAGILSNNYSVTAGAVSLGDGTITGSGTITSGVSFTVTNDTAAAAQIDNVLAGSGSFTQSGSGTTTLSGSNSYTGGTVIAAGQLTLGSRYSLGSTNASLTIAAATLFTLNSVTVGAVSLGNGTITGGGAITATNFLATNTKAALVANPINGTGSFTQSGGGTTTLSGASAYTGGTLITGGQITLGNVRALGASNAPLNVAGGVLSNPSYSITNSAISLGNGSITGSGALTSGTGFTATNSGNALIANKMVSSGGFTQSGAGVTTLSGANAYTGATTISAGSLLLGTGGSLATNSSITDNGTFGFSGSGALTEGTSFASTISGTGGLLQSGTGTTTLSGSNSYQGGTLITAGQITLGNVNALGATNASLNVAAGILSNTYSVTAGAVSLGNGSIAGSGTLTSGAGFTATNDAAASVANSLVSTGAFTQSGVGTTTLSGSNSYQGGTLITAGQITLGNVNALGATNASLNVAAGILSNTYSVTAGAVSLGNGSIAGSGTLTSGAGFTATNDAAASVANSLVSTGAFTQNGIGTTTLSGSNSYAGTTIITNGLLDFATTKALYGANTNAWKATNVMIASNAAIAFGVTNYGTNNLQVLLQRLTTNAGFGLNAGASFGLDDVGTNYSFTNNLGDSVNGSLGLTVLGNGTVTLLGRSTYTGPTVLSTGTLLFGTGGALSPNSAITDNDTLGFIGTNNLTQGTDFAAISGTGIMIQNGTGTTTLANSNSYAGGTTVQTGTLQVTTNGVINHAYGDLDIATTASAAFLLNGGSVYNNGGIVGYAANYTGTATVNGGSWNNASFLLVGELGTGSLSVNGGTVSNATATIADQIGSSGLAAVNGGSWNNSGDLIVGNAGNGTLTIGGSGTVTGSTNGLLGAAVLGNQTGSAGTVTMSGGSWINSGDLIVGNNGTGALTITSGTLSNGYNNIGAAIGYLTGSTGSVTMSGGTWINDGYLLVGSSGTGSMAMSGGIMSSYGGSIGDSAGSTGSMTVSGGIWSNNELYVGYSGTGTLTISGTGTVSVGGGAGPVTIASQAGSVGTLNFGTNGGSAGTLSAGTIAFGSGAGVINFNQTNATTLSGSISGNGTVNQLGTGTTTLTGNNSYTGTTTISAGTLQIGNGGASGTLGTTNVIDNGTLALNRSDVVTLGNTISGTGAFIQKGTGTTTLTGNNSYTGTTTISAGTLQIGNGGASGTLGTTNVIDNGTLALNRSDVVTLGNTISGTGAFIQKGTGTTTLTGNNSYTGTTTISAGTLKLGAGASLASTNINLGTMASQGTLDLTGKSSGYTVATNQALSGSGSVTMAASQTLTIASGANLAPGNNGSGVLTVNGSLTLATNSSTSMEVTGTNAAGASGGFDQIAVKLGNFSAGGTLTINISGLVLSSTPITDNIFSYSNGGSWNSAQNFFSVVLTGLYPGTMAYTSAGTTWSWQSTFGNETDSVSLNMTTGVLTMTAVPEPSTYALFGLGALTLAVAYGRRRV